MSKVIIYIVIFTFAVAFCASDFDRIQSQFSALFGQKPFASTIGVGDGVRCATPIVLDLRKNLHLLTVEQREMMSHLLARPSLPAFYDTPEGHFRIHYNNMITDTGYVYRFARYFEYAWAYEIDTLGFLPPVSDGGLGGNERIDVYIDPWLDPYGAYGLTNWDGIAGPAPWNDQSGYILVRTSFDGITENEDPEGSAIGAMKVTAAHEFFHLVQFAYDADDEYWLYEIESTWMEDVCYDYVNDYYNILYAFFDRPYKSIMDYGTSLHEYGSCVWFHYLHENFGIALIREIFEEMKYSNGLFAIEAALGSFGTNLRDEFFTFECWNYLTGTRSDEWHYDEGENFPEVAIEATVGSFPFSHAPSSTNKPRSFAMNVVEMPETPDYGIIIQFTGESPAFWKIGAVFPSDSSRIVLPDTDGFVYCGGRPAALVIVAMGTYSSSFASYGYNVTVRPCLGVRDVASSVPVRGLIASPNPFNDKVQIETDHSGILHIADLAGRIVFSKPVSIGERVVWQPKESSAGVYFAYMHGTGVATRIVYLP